MTSRKPEWILTGRVAIRIGRRRLVDPCYASFADGAVTVARVMTDTFAGISPRSVQLFVLGQSLGGAAAALFARWLLGEKVTASPEPNSQ